MKKRTALLASTGISSWGAVPDLPAVVSHAPTPPARICDSCHCVYDTSRSACPFCGRVTSIQ